MCMDVMLHLSPSYQHHMNVSKDVDMWLSLWYILHLFRFPVPHFIDLVVSLSPLPSALVFSPVIYKVLSRRDPALLTAGLELGLWNFGGAVLLSSGGNGSPENNATLLFAFTVRQTDARGRRQIETIGAMMITFFRSIHMNLLCLCRNSAKKKIHT